MQSQCYLYNYDGGDPVSPDLLTAELTLELVDNNDYIHIYDKQTHEFIGTLHSKFDIFTDMIDVLEHVKERVIPVYFARYEGQVI